MVVSSRTGIARLAATLPFGPAFMSGSWQSSDEETPALANTVITRTMPDGRCIAAVVLVDRTCLGVKNAFVDGPMTRAALDDLIRSIGEVHEEGIEETSVLEAQSVIYNAIDFARSMGFEPQRDFSELVVGPRPETRLETPLSHPSQPVYVAGPNDDVARIANRLERAGYAVNLVRCDANEEELKEEAPLQFPG